MIWHASLCSSWSVFQFHVHIPQPTSYLIPWILSVKTIVFWQSLSPYFLQRFDVSCQQPGVGWITVLNQTSAEAHAQFEAIADPEERQFPCTSCWKQLNFDSVCTGVAWRISNMNGPTFYGRIYLFEMKFAHISLPVLPPSLPPKIQGWCIKHQVVDGINSEKLGPTGGAANNRVNEYTLATFQADFTSIPCASQFAVEMFVPKAERWGHRFCTQNNRLNVKTESGKSLFLHPVSDGQLNGCTGTRDRNPGWTVKVEARYTDTAQAQLNIAKSSQEFTLITQNQVPFTSFNTPGLPWSYFRAIL